MMLRAENITGGYGEALVHRDISLSVDVGEILVVAGKNGCGKTTLARHVANYMPDMTKEDNETASRDRYPFLSAQVEREGGEGQLMLLRSKKSIFSF